MGTIPREAGNSSSRRTLGSGRWGTDRARKIWVVASVLVGTLAAGETPRLPEAAEKAVERLFPSATIVAVGHEPEAGVACDEVRVRDRSALREIEVTAGGVIGEVEGVVAMGDVPPCGATVRSTGP